MKCSALAFVTVRLALLGTSLGDSNSSILAKPRSFLWRKNLTLLVIATAVISLLRFEVAQAHQKVGQPEVPPMLETPRPLDNLEPKEPDVPQKTPASRKSAGKVSSTPQRLSVTMKSIGKERANVRAKPSLKSEILFQAFLGNPIKVENQQNGWVHVSDYKHNSGWVYKPLVSDIKTAVVLVEDANIRKGPSLKRPVVEQASKGEIYKIFAEKGSWVKVGYYRENEVIGWIRDDLVWGE